MTSWSRDAPSRGLWGLPASPLIPSALAEPLADIPLPVELRAAIAGHGSTSVGDLTGLRWEGVPLSEVDKVTDAVIRLISRHLSRIANTKILRSWPPALSPAAMPWSKRVSNILHRTELIRDPVRLASLKVKELLEIRNLGVRSLIEIASALDQVTAAAEDLPLPERLSTHTSLRAPAWGEPGSALLPIQLRELHEDKVVPRWLIDELSLPPGSTYAALDSTVWNSLEFFTSRAETFALRVLQEGLPLLRQHFVLPDLWPDGLSLKSVPWKPRVYNGLEAAGLLDEPERLSVLTFGELVRVRSMGLKSILDFTVTAEAVLAQVAEPGNVDIQQILLEYGDEEWLDRVSRADWRFMDLIPPELDKTLDQVLEEVQGIDRRRPTRLLAEILPQIRERVLELERQPLDTAVRHFFKGYARVPRDLEVLLARFGLKGSRPATLEVVGQDFGITRERVRQVVGKIRERLPEHSVLMPRIPEALSLLAERTPLGVHEASQLLMSKGITTQPLHPLGLIQIAELFQYDVALGIETVKGKELVNTLRSPNLVSLLQVARAAAGRYGAYNVDDLTTKLAFECSTTEARRLLEHFSSTHFLTDEWFWLPDIPRGRERLRNVTRKILSVTDPMKMGILRSGVRRVYRWRGIEIVPPLDVLRAYYAVHPEFEIDAQDTVSSVESLDYRKELADTERKLVEIFEETPNGVLDRQSLEEAAKEKYLNPNSLSVFMTYSPIIDHPALNAWTLRGRKVEPAAIETVREIAASRGREKRTLSYGWTENGELWLALRVANVNSPVFGIPAAIQSYVANRSFQAVTDDGYPAGTLAVNPEGTSWGYGPFLRRKGGDVGDVLMLRFDLASSVVALSLEDEGVFEN